MRRNFITILTIFSAMTVQAFAETNFDNWKTYMAYGDITDIEPAGNSIYVLSSGDLFSYNVNDESVTTYDKVYPLTDCTISNIAWNNSAKRLIIVYDNYNIDLLDNKSNVINISDYKDKSLNAEKKINNIFINGNLAYLCTAFGLVQIDMSQGLIRETFNISKNVTNCTLSGNYIYVQTTDGVFKGNRNDNLIDPANWTAATEHVSFNNPNDIHISNDNGYTQYYVYDNTNKCYWSNQSDNKLQSYTKAPDGTTTITRHDINPLSPSYNTFGYMKIHNGKLYTCNGGIWGANKPASLQIYNPSDATWNVLDCESVSEKYNIPFKDILCLDVDPSDDNHIMAGNQRGLFEFKDGEAVNFFNANNSPLSYNNALIGNDNYVIVSSLFYDKDNTLWIINHYASSQGILQYTKDGEWKYPEKTLPGTSFVFSKIMGYDRYNRIWINNGRTSTPAVYCYSADLSNLYVYNNFINEDNTIIENVMACRSIAEDKEGNIWVGTNVGLFVLNDEYQQDPSKGFYQIKVPRNDGTNYADYLLSGLDIQTIAIDNANRKWIGTASNGLYVISNDNMVQEANFTTSNSSILSNNILNVAIDKTNGIVYIGTDKGLCSVQSNASQTNEEMNKDNVWAYPNPVKPDYTGLISIVGLSFNSDVKITTTSGTLVAQGKSTGGTFQWDGKDLKGKRVASGIYMVNAAKENGEKGTVCKIAVIN